MNPASPTAICSLRDFAEELSRGFSVLFKIFHPAGAVVRPGVPVGTAGYGPRTVYPERSIPLKNKQLLKVNLPDREIDETGIYSVVVPVDDVTLYFLPSQAHITLPFRGLMQVFRKAFGP